MGVGVRLGKVEARRVHEPGRVNPNTSLLFNPLTLLTRRSCIRRRRWLQDTSKRKLADFSIVFVPPPFLFPRVHPRLTRRLIKTSAPDKKRSGCLKLLAGFTRKKASTRRVNRKIADSTRNQRVLFSRYLAANYAVKKANGASLQRVNPPTATSTTTTTTTITTTTSITTTTTTTTTTTNSG